jgi:hypothetical protein
MEINSIKRPSRSPRSMSLGVGKLRNIQRVQAVDIFALVYSGDDRRFINVTGQWQLNQDSVNCRVCNSTELLI